MRRIGMCLALVVWMFGLVACGGEEAVDTSAEIPQITNAPTTTITPIKTEAPLTSKLPSITEVPDITKASDVTEAPVSSELPVPTEMPEITVISRSWPQVQAELEQQNLQYEGYYTLTNF